MKNRTKRTSDAIVLKGGTRRSHTTPAPGIPETLVRDTGHLAVKTRIKAGHGGYKFYD